MNENIFLSNIAQYDTVPAGKIKAIFRRIYDETKEIVLCVE